MKDPIFARLLAVAEEASVTLGAAESLTGGLFGYSLCRASGAAGTFCGSIVTYSSEVKHRLLEVPPDGPVVSAEAAIAMAASARVLLACDVAVSLTGVAGPETQDGMPIGSVFMALADHTAAISHELRLDGSPDEIRQAAAVAAAQAMLDHIAP